MSISIRLKRAAAAELDQLTLSSGQLAVSTDDNSLRIHDGNTQGGVAVKVKDVMASLGEELDNLDIGDVSSLQQGLDSLEDQSALDDTIATLNPEGVVATENLPSYVEDIIVVNQLTDLPDVGAIGKLYVVESLAEMYRWSGGQQAWYQIGYTIEDSEDLSEGQTNLYFTEQRVRDLFSSEGDVTYDSETGEFGFDQSVDSVNDYGGDVVLDQGHFGLEQVEDFPVATEVQAQDLTSNDSYMTAGLNRTSANTVGMFEDELGWYLEGGGLDIPTGPGPIDLVHGDTYLGFYGTLPPSELFTAEQLSTKLGIENVGSLINTDFVWLKFSYNERTLFIPSKPLRYGMSWLDLYRNGLVYGENAEQNAPDSVAYFDQNRYVERPDFGRFKLRLPEGRSGDTTTPYDVDTSLYDPQETHDSEWNDLMYRVAASVNASDPSEPVGEWLQLTNNELGLTGGGGASTLTKSVDENGEVVYRGFNHVDRVTTTLLSTSSTSFAWRPVLEFYTPTMQLFDISEVNYATIPVQPFVGGVSVESNVRDPLGGFEAIVSQSPQPVVESGYTTSSSVVQLTSLAKEPVGLVPVTGIQSNVENVGINGYVGSGSVSESGVYDVSGDVEAFTMKPVVTASYDTASDITQINNFTQDTQPASHSLYPANSAEFSVTGAGREYYVGGTAPNGHVYEVESEPAESLSVEPVREAYYASDSDVIAVQGLSRGSGDSIAPPVEVDSQTTQYTLTKYVGGISVSQLT